MFEKERFKATRSASRAGGLPWFFSVSEIVKLPVAGTLVAAVVQDDAVYWVHCGDSRFYLTRGAQIVGRTRESTQEDLFNAIENGDLPRWQMQVQVMPEAEIYKHWYNPFDLTKVWPHGDYPPIDIGVLTEFTLGTSVGVAWVVTEIIAVVFAALAILRLYVSSDLLDRATLWTGVLVLAVVGAPGQRGILKRRRTEDQGAQFHGPLRLKRAMGEQPMVAQRDAQAGQDVKHHKLRHVKPREPVVPNVSRHRCQGDQQRAQKERSVGPVNLLPGKSRHSFQFQSLL